ncbi:Ig-like domain-containing protein [Galactobacter valiniphilus]|uniref:Ig-like domain-containing protein n=1 Tax=Galactobacter valiniphilus TaxID=2676122 RepID=UPI003734E8CE
MSFWRRGDRKGTGRGPLVATASGAAAIALVAGIAVVAQGYERSEQDLSDASVWVSSGERTLLGHANTAISKLSTAIKLEGDGQTIAQDSQHVILHVPEKNTLSVIDPAQAEPVGAVNLPAGKPQVAAAGSWIAILDPTDGDVWVRTLGEVQGFEPSADPDGQAGVEAVVAVDQEGRWAGYSQKASRVSVGFQGSTKSYDVAFSKPAAKAQVSLIGGDPAVYNPASNELWFKNRLHSLSAVVTDPESGRLQAPTTTPGDAALAHNGGLAVARANEDRVDLPVSAVDGSTAAPQRVGACLYAAWSSKRAVQWCEGRDPETFPLRGDVPVASLLLRSNADTVVATEPTSGATWSLQNGGALINNWDDFAEQSKIVERQRDDLDVPPEPEAQQKAPVAKDDAFGARAGRANLLPVLLNDADPNGDPLIITEVSGADELRADVSIVENGQKLQLTPRDDATGSFSLRYSISDGRGGKASATATVNLVGPDVNTAPQQARPSKTSLVVEGKSSINVLQDWVDPESDPIYLASATLDAPSSAASTPEGRVDVSQGGGDPGVEQARIRVSDGSATGDGTLSVTVYAKGKAPIIAENYTLSGYVGNELVTLPLEAARGGTSDLTLAQAAPAEGSESALKVSASYADGKVRIIPSEPGTHRVSYSVRDGQGNETAAGIIRVETQRAPEGASAPVVSPTTAFVYLNNTTDVDVLANAYDPAGKVLSIDSVSQATEAGISVEVVEREHLRVLLTRDVVSPQKLKVVVSNGTEKTTGDLIVVRVPEPTKEQAPVARDDAVKARAGDVADIAVLANDSQADGKPITLVRDLVERPKAGLLVAAGDRLRYLAPETPGTYTARYQITSAGGLTATGSVRIDVIGRDEAGNREPSAPTVTARTTAGQAVKVRIPLAGADPDGDSVSLNGVLQQPSKGSVVFEGDVMEYTANPASVGTDSFTYQVVDALGAASSGTIRVGIDAAATASAPPVAQDDLITTRPDTALSVDVTANDTNNASGDLSVVVDRVIPESAKAVVENRRITLRTPSSSGTVAVLYTASDRTGAASQAWLYIDVRKDAPLAAPTTQDRRLALTDIADRDTVPVDVLSATTFTEGSAADLAVSVPEGYGEAKVLPDSQVEVRVGDSQAVIPFTVSRKDAPGIGSTSFITVPGRQHAKPELRTDAPSLSVESGEELAIKLADHVIAADNRPVTVSNPKSVTASNGEASVRGDNQLVFRSDPEFWGQATVSFTATDGRESAQLTLKITVNSKKDQPPTLKDASIALESGASHVTDLRALTEVAGGEQQAQGLEYSATGGDPALLTFSVVGDKLQLKAVEGDTVGRTATIRLKVVDAKGLSAESTATVTISRSQKALPRAADDTATVRRGDAVTVDVLGNDVSPYPDRSLSVVSVRPESVVKGVSVSTADGQRKVTVRASDDSDTGVSTIVYTIQDSTGDPHRQAVGQLRVTVQDVPDAPSQAPSIVEQRPKDRTVVLSVPGADANGSPITGYEYRANGDSGPSGTCSNPQACVVKGLEYGKPYSFQMRASNALGAGAWSGRSASVTMDKRPNAPRSVKAVPSDSDRGGHTLLVSWQPPEAADWGSAISGYQLKITGAGLNSVFSYGEGTTSATLKDGQIKPGQHYVLAVTATNLSGDSEAATGDVTAVGAPSVSNAKAGISGGGTKIEATWDVNDGGATARSRVVPASQAGQCRPELSGYDIGGTSWSSDLSRNDERAFVVQVSNGLFCDQAATKEIDVSVDRPSVDTDDDTIEGTDGKFGTQPKYRISGGSGQYTFVKITDSDAKPSAEDGGWDRANNDGAWRNFGELNKTQWVWAMSCRSDERKFCSSVAPGNPQTKQGLDIGFDVTPPSQCVADGSGKITARRHDAESSFEYKWVDSSGNAVSGGLFGSWRDVPADGIPIPTMDDGEKAYLKLKTARRVGGDWYRYEPSASFATCTGPAEPSSSTPPSSSEPPSTTPSSTDPSSSSGP